jgi:hypothetical protein
MCYWETPDRILHFFFSETSSRSFDYNGWPKKNVTIAGVKQPYVIAYDSQKEGEELLVAGNKFKDWKYLGAASVRAIEYDRESLETHQRSLPSFLRKPDVFVFTISPQNISKEK